MLRACEMCDFGATAKCDYCSVLVCPEHYENVVVDKGRKEGCIVLQACPACTPEAQRVRRERADRAQQVRHEQQEQQEQARGEEDRNSRLALLDQVITAPTTPLGARAKAHADVALIKYGDVFFGLVGCMTFIALLFLLLRLFYIVAHDACCVFELDGSESFYNCAGVT